MSKLVNELVTLDKLKPHPKNVRQGDIGAIVESLNAHGQYRPIVVQRSTGYILAGNHTYKAARQVGLTALSVNYLDVDDDEALRILLVDNRTNDLASYDDSALVEILKDLMETELRLEGTGFAPEDLDELIAGLDEPLELAGDPDDVPDVETPTSVLGDVWRLGPHRVMCGDSTSTDDVTTLMDGKKADMVFTDPPYGMNLDTDYKKMDEAAHSYAPVIGDDSQFDASWLLASFAYCEEIFLWGADYYVETLRRKYPDLGSWVIWDKYSDSDRQGLLDGRFGSAFETCWSKSRHKRELARVLLKTNYTSRGDETRVHPTQKPVALAEWFFDRWGSKEDLVVDLFGGSGSTLIACHQTNRVCYMMELDPHYVDVICARFQQLTGIIPINEATGKEHSFIGID